MIKAILRLGLIAFFCLAGCTTILTPDAPNYSLIQWWDMEPLADQDTLTSDPIFVGKARFFGVHYIVDTGDVDTPDVDIYYEMSSQTTGSTFVQPEGGGMIADDLTDEEWHVDAIAPPPMKYIRFVAVGNAGNDADTEITFYLFVQTDG